MPKRNTEMFKVLYNMGIPVPKVVQTTDGKGFLVTKSLKGAKVEDVQSLGDEWFYRFGKIIGEVFYFVKGNEERLKSVLT